MYVVLSVCRAGVGAIRRYCHRGQATAGESILPIYIPVSYQYACVAILAFQCGICMCERYTCIPVWYQYVWRIYLHSSVVLVCVENILAFQCGISMCGGYACIPVWYQYVWRVSCMCCSIRMFVILHMQRQLLELCKCS